MADPTSGALHSFGEMCNKAVEYAGEKINDCIMAIGSFLDRLTEGVKGMGKSALVNVEGLGSKMNPMNWMRQNSPSPDSTPSAPPKLGRSAHFHEVGIAQPEKPSISLPEKNVSRYQGALSEFKGIVGGNVGITLADCDTISAPSCPHFGNSIGGMAYAR